MFLVRVGGATVGVNMSDRPSLLREVQGRLRQGAGFAVATLNLDHVVKLRSSEEFRRAYLRQDMVTADGQPIVWLSKLSGRPVSLVTGSDLVDPLAGLAADERVPLALVGATTETLERAASELTARHRWLEIVAKVAPGQRFDAQGAEAGEVIEALRRSGARLVFLALGAPRQEMFAARCREALPEVGFVSVGAGLDFIAQSQRRAPLWMRQLAVEWLWRMLSDPRRLGGRYIQCAMSLPRLAVDALAERRLAELPSDAGAQAVAVPQR